jgi:uncharacterized protein (DUF2267 family)
MAKKLPPNVAAYFRKDLPPDVAAYFRKQGAKGGKIGGKMSLERMTPAERTARAKKAGQASAAARKAARKAKP